MTNAAKHLSSEILGKDGAFPVAEILPADPGQKTVGTVGFAPSEIGRIFDHINLFMIRLDAQGIVTLWTTATEKILKRNAADVLGKPLIECGVQWNSARMEEGVKMCLHDGSSVRYEDVSLQLNSEEDRFLSVTFIPLHDDQDGPSGVACLGYDRTERKIMEIFFAENNKLKAIGQLVAAMNQEITAPIQYMGDNMSFLKSATEDLNDVVEKSRTLLTAIRGRAIKREHIEELEKAFEVADWEYLRDEIPSSISQVENGIDRVANTVQAINSFSQFVSDDCVHLDLNRAVESSLVITRTETKFISKIVTELEKDLPTVLCNQGQIHQVLVHLIQNACDAIEARIDAKQMDIGTIKITTRTNGDQVEVWVSDDGMGIPEDLHNRIFDPFFSTKPMGKRTGHGLAFCRSVVEGRHGGRLRFETVPGNGTIFIIELPCGGTDCDR